MMRKAFTRFRPFAPKLLSTPLFNGKNVFNFNSNNGPSKDQIEQFIKKMNHYIQIKQKQKLDEEERRRKEEEIRRKQKLDEEERRRKQKLDEEERRRKQKLDEEERRRKQKLDEEKSNSKFYNKKHFWHVLQFVTTGLTFGVVYRFSNEYAQQKVQKIDLKVHSQSFLENQDYFCPNSKVQQRIREIIKKASILIQKKYIFPVTLILGGQGIGKTSSLKHIINEMRQKEQNQAVYYIPLSSKQAQKENDLTNTKILKLKNLLMAISKNIKQIKEQEKNQQKSTYIFVDDINQMQLAKQEQREQVVQLIYKLQKQGAKIILISSSTSFYYDVWQKTDLAKLTSKKIQIIWKQDDPANNQKALQKMGQYFDIKNKKILEQVVKQGFNLRQTRELLYLISEQIKIGNGIKTQETKNGQEKAQKIIQKHNQANQAELKNKLKNDEEKALKIIKQYDQGNYASFIDRLDSYKFKSKDYPNMKIDILKQVLQSDAPETIKDGLNNILKITDKMVKIYRYPKEETLQMIHNLDRSNLIIFCHPRTQALKRYIQKYIDSARKKQ